MVVLKNVRLILRNELVCGSIAVEGGVIADFSEGLVAPLSAEDCEGDYIIPGLIDVHSDNVEKHVALRPNVIWPSLPAAIAHDAHVIGAGITTIFDAIGLSGGKAGNREALSGHLISGLYGASQLGILRAEHFLHIRCEVSDPEIVPRFEAAASHPMVRMMSLMDHTPGQRVFTDIEAWRDYRRKGQGLTESQLDDALRLGLEAHDKYSDKNRVALAEIASAKAFVIASHDDATDADVLENMMLGGRIAEFPTTLGAAQFARHEGLSIVMGAPNLVRGGSHIGNVSTQVCAQADLLDILASDYAPISLLHGALLLTRPPIGYSLAAAIATVSANPASAAGLTDRGEIAIGKRADLVRMRVFEDTPVVRNVWKDGRLVH